MRVFITGGTGFIGRLLTLRVTEVADEVRLLVRDLDKAKEFTHPKIRLVHGHILDSGTLLYGMKGCDLVFHLGAYAKPWSKDPGLPYRINVQGSECIFNAALENGVRKVVYTSTAGTMGFSAEGNSVNEETNPHPEYFNEYERTKALAEEKAMEFFRRGLGIIIVNPSRVYGPGLLSVSNSMTRIIRLYKMGKWRIIPGDGNSIGNYVFTEDVISGHLLAAEKGRAGQRYILGGESLTFNQLFGILGKILGHKRRMIHLNKGVLNYLAGMMEYISQTTGLPPVISREWVKKYLTSCNLTSKKAMEELGYIITPFEEGASKTIAWLD